MHSSFDLKKKRRITGDLKMKRPITTGEEEKQEKGKNKRLEKVKQKEKKIKHQKISNDVVIGKKEINNDVVTGTKDPVYEKYLGEPDLPEEWTLRTAYLSPIPVPRDHCKYSLFEELVKKGIRQYNRCNGTLYQVQDLFGVSRYRRYQAIRGTIIFTAKEPEEAAENFLVTFRVLLADEHKIIDFCGKVDWNMADHGD